MPMDGSKFQEAAAALLEKGGGAPAEETPAETTEEHGVEEIPDADEEGKLEPVETAEQKPEDKPEEKPAAKEPEKKDPPKDWEKIAREKAEARRKAEAEKLSQADQIKANALLEAARSGDAMSLLTAAGIPWSAAAQQVINGGKAADKKADPEKQDGKELSPIEKELAEVKAELQAQKYERSKAKVMDQIKTIAGSKAPLVRALEAEDEVFAFLDQYVRETGEKPAETLEESIEIACEAVEMRHRKKGEKYRDALTKLGSGNNKDPKQATPSTASNKVAKTLTNDTGSGPRSVSPVKTKVARSEEDYRLEALKVLESGPE